jgi:pimeloyl-ACP methyl ester carboxylesterase
MEPLLRTTPSGAPFALLPAQPGGPAPTLLLLALAAADTLVTEPYCLVGRLLYARGWNVLSLDLPCHGADRRPGEPPQLEGWAERVRSGEDIAVGFQTRVNEVVGHLVTMGLADSAQMAVAGTSRGGFMALQAAAGNASFRAVTAFAPVTDLLVLREFAGQEQNPLTRRLALVNAVSVLADRAVWITIGNADARVGTGHAERFARAVGHAAVARGLEPRVTVQVLPVPGHTSLPGWHHQAADWLWENARPPVQALSDSAQDTGT